MAKRSDISAIFINNGTLTRTPASSVAGFDQPANKISFLQSLASEKK